MTDKETPPADPVLDGYCQRPSLQGLLLETRRVLRLHQGLGITHYPRTPELVRFLSGPSRETQEEQRTGPVFPGAPPNGPASEANHTGLLAEIRDCHRCPRHLGQHPPLAGTEGAEKKLLIIADAPTADDARQGLPFYGKAGELLQKMLAAIGMDRATVSLTFLCKCHSPELPDQEAVAACLPFLHRQITALAPTVICAMGTKTAQTLLHRAKPLSHLRGTAHEYRGIPLVATFPPDFLLKNVEMKKAAWLDLQLIRKLCARGSGTK